jgi:hypothetical protein
MATALSPVGVNHKALTAIGTPAAGDVTGNTVPNSGGKTLLYVENSGSTSRTLGVAFGRTVDDRTIAAWSFTVAAGPGTDYLYQLGPVSDYGSVVTVTPSHAEVLIKAFNLA